MADFRSDAGSCHCVMEGYRQIEAFEQKKSRYAEFIPFDYIWMRGSVFRAVQRQSGARGRVQHLSV